MKWTEAKRKALEAGRVVYRPKDGSVWAFPATGETFKVRLGTFNSLYLDRLIAKVDETEDALTYENTPAGHAALEQRK